MKDGKVMQEALKIGVIICDFSKKEAPNIFKMRFFDKSRQKCREQIKTYLQLV
jgi:hypothetical protein